MLWNWGEKAVRTTDTWGFQIAQQIPARPVPEGLRWARRALWVLSTQGNLGVPAQLIPRGVRPTPKDAARPPMGNDQLVPTHSEMILLLHEDAFLPLKLMGVMWLK